MKIDDNDLDKALSHAIEILERHGCEWWLMAGSCLGAIRSNSYLDNDIDIGVHEKYITLWDTFIAEFKSAGFELFMEWIHKGKKIELSFVFRESSESSGQKPVKMDLFFYFEKGDYWWHGLFGPDLWGLYKALYPVVFRKELFSDLEEIVFRGMPCYVPNPPEEYLEKWYGRSWRIPTRDYLSWRDCKAINKKFLQESLSGR